MDAKRTQQPNGLLHPFQPVIDARSRVLVLGSFPSVKSRETAFYYGHPQNRFWRLLAALFSDTVPETAAAKTAFYMHRNHIALWDVVAACDYRRQRGQRTTAAPATMISLPGCRERISGRFSPTVKRLGTLYRAHIWSKQTGIPVHSPAVHKSGERGVVAGAADNVAWQPVYDAASQRM